MLEEEAALCPGRKVKIVRGLLIISGEAKFHFGKDQAVKRNYGGRERETYTTVLPNLPLKTESLPPNASLTSWTPIFKKSVQIGPVCWLGIMGVEVQYKKRH